MSKSQAAFASQRQRSAAFSLVEVVLAVGVVAFAFVAILGLLPAGMTQFRQAIDTTVCAQIAQRVIGDAQQTEFLTLIDEKNIPPNAISRENYTFRAPKVQEPEFRYFDERGEEVIPSSNAARSNPKGLSKEEQAKVVYHVNVRIMPQTRLPKTSSNTEGGEQVATLTVQVANNPGNAAINISTAAKSSADSPDRQLFVKTPGVTFITYSAQIARNQ